MIEPDQSLLQTVEMSKSKRDLKPQTPDSKPRADSNSRPDPRFSSNRIFLWVLFLGSIFGSMAVMAYFRLPPSQAPLLTYKVLNTFPHDDKAFTQGLLYVDGKMIESTGRTNESTLRLVNVATGVVEQKIELPKAYFAEGIAIHGSKLYQLTFQNNKIRIYDKDSLKFLEEKPFPFEGWGLTADSDYLIHSDGSSTIRFIRPDTLEVQNKITVRDGRRTISNINELEYFDGRIYANVWHEDFILQIIPATGRVSARIDMTGILQPKPGEKEAVLNGIAVNKESNTFYVTGKLWPKLFEVKFVLPEREKP